MAEKIRREAICGKETKANQKEVTEKSPDTYAAMALALGQLVDSKQAQYGDSIAAMGPLLKLHFPNGIKPEQYNTVALLVRIEDKLGRLTRGNGEGDEDAWKDIAGYGLLGSRQQQLNKDRTNGNQG